MLEEFGDEAPGIFGAWITLVKIASTYLKGLIPKQVVGAIQPQPDVRFLVLARNPVGFKAFRSFRPDVKIHVAIFIHLYLNFVEGAQSRSVLRILDEGPSGVV
jgi:hypothetical protein